MNRRYIAVFSIALFLITLTAFSVSISITTVDPLASRAYVEYVLGKASGTNPPEIRSVLLNGNPVSSVSISFYMRALLQFIRVTVTLYDDNGIVIGSGSDCGFYIFPGIQSMTVPVSPNPLPSQVARVETSIQVVLLCN
ncbi:MAG: hypothetical protein NYU90_03125 [Aigarchaeota archaeon]|nr:hypothetical protein [Candidatus Calditenuis fumarioli]